MPSGAVARPNSALLGALALILGLTVWRIAFLPVLGIDLFVDESQYWLWGRELTFGHYSKPPMIGWLIRASTEILGTDSAFAIRAWLPVVHALTAVGVMWLGVRIGGAATGAWAGAIFATLPAVGLGSILVSTDTPLMCAIAFALVFWHRAAKGGGRGDAALMGLCLGLGLLSKYALLFALAGIGAAMIADRGWRLGRAQIAVAAGVALAVFAPNLIWNALMGFPTFQHTADNADWQGFALNWQGAAIFLAAQFAVAGPVVFATLLAGFIGLAGRERGAERALVIVALAPLGIVTAQALASHAYANWAVGAYVPGALAAAILLGRQPMLRAGAVALNLVLCLGLPVAFVQAEAIRGPDGRLVLRRHIGQAEVSAAAIAVARAAMDAPVLVASDRWLLADLFYRTRARGGAGDVAVHALPEGPRVSHHYALLYALPPEMIAADAPVLWFGAADQPVPCATPGPTLARWVAAEGVHGGRAFQIVAVGAGCLGEAAR
ncbi:MAG: ArnT family glycosyltransferase [Gemmobacter sp.]